MACTTGHCTAVCAGSGTGSCTGSCWNACVSACAFACTTYCGNNCKGYCNTTCTSCSGCGSGCASSCSGCRGSCTNSCTSCTSCSGSCSGQCQGTCKTTCSGTCSGDCNDACTASGKMDAINNLADTISIDIGGTITIEGLKKLKEHAQNEVTRRGKSPSGALAGSAGTNITASDSNLIFEDIKTLGQTYHVDIGDIVRTDSFSQSIAYLQGLMKQNLKQ